MQPLARSAFQSVVDGIPTDLYTLRGSGGIEVAICNFGARLVRLAVPDGDGDRIDVTLGYDSLAGYLDGQPSMGAFIGRWAGRLGAVHGLVRALDRGGDRLVGVQQHQPA